MTDVAAAGPQLADVGPAPTKPASKGGRPPGSRDTKPRRTRPRRDTPPSTPRTAPLERRIGQQVAMVGTIVAAFDETCGMSILAGTEALAKSLDALAKENPSVRRVLESMLTGSAWAQVIAAVGAIAIPIGAHHGLLPGSLGGLFSGSAGAPATGVMSDDERAAFDAMMASAATSAAPTGNGAEKPN